MARKSDAHRDAYGEPVSVGRSMIAGSIAGLLACVGFVNMQGYGGLSTDYWNSGANPAPAPRLEANAGPPSGAQAPQPEGGNAPAEQYGAPAEQGYGPPQPEQSYGASQPEQGYEPPQPQQGYAPPQPPQQDYGPPTQQPGGANNNPMDRQQLR